MSVVRYGVIGVNGIGRAHIRAATANESVELAAVADIDAASLSRTSAELGVHGFTDYRDMLDAGVVDAVSIATPHHLLGDIGLQCLRAGVHTFIEKPFALRVAQADAMVAAAKSRDLKICVGFQYRTFRTPQTMKHIIDTGAIGEIARVLWTWIDFRPESYFERDAWRTTWQHAGGGVLMNQVSHDLDLICWLVGKPAQVSALIGNQLHKAEIEDVACASVLFANGACGSLQFTVNQPKGYSVRQIAGDKGAIVIQDVRSLIGDQDDTIHIGTYDDSLKTTVAPPSGGRHHPVVTWRRHHLPGSHSAIRRWARRLPGHQSLSRGLAKPRAALRRVGLLKQSKPDGHSVLMDSFVVSILAGGEPIVTGHSALPALELINAIVLSAVRKKTVELPLDREEYDQLLEDLSSGKIQVPRLA